MNKGFLLTAISIGALSFALFADVPAPIAAAVAEMKETGGGVRAGVAPDLGVYIVAAGRSRYRPGALARCRELAQVNAKKALAEALEQTVKAHDTVALQMTVGADDQATASAFVSSVTESTVDTLLKGVQIVEAGPSADGEEMVAFIYTTAQMQDSSDALRKAQMQWGDKGVVSAVGIAEDRALAEKNALRSAVEQVAGTLVVGKVSVNEKEEMHSRLAVTAGALVEEYRVVRESKVDLEFRVEVLARVDKRKLYDNYRSYFKCLDNPVFCLVATDESLIRHFRQFFVDKGFQLTANPVEAHYFIKLNGRFKDRATPGNAKSAGTMLDLGIQVESVDGSRTLLTMNEKQAKDSETLDAAQRREEVSRRIFGKLEKRLHAGIQDLIVRLLDDADNQSAETPRAGTFL